MNDLKKEGRVLAITSANELPISASGYYAVTTLNTDNKESNVSAYILK